MTAHPLARLDLARRPAEALFHHAPHEPEIRRCTFCGAPFCTSCEGVNDGEPCACELHLRTHAREAGR